jgi:hypothetical protein
LSKLSVTPKADDDDDDASDADIHRIRINRPNLPNFKLFDTDSDTEPGEDKEPPLKSPRKLNLVASSRKVTDSGENEEPPLKSPRNLNRLASSRKVIPIQSYLPSGIEAIVGINTLTFHV